VESDAEKQHLLDPYGMDERMGDYLEIVIMVLSVLSLSPLCSLFPSCALSFPCVVCSFISVCRLALCLAYALCRVSTQMRLRITLHHEMNYNTRYCVPCALCVCVPPLYIPPVYIPLYSLAM
jgi:hypothetical protein